MSSDSPSSSGGVIDVSSTTNLRGQYLAIGNALLEYEQGSSSWTVSPETLADHFRTSVAFISTEVLDSYLEDLLDATYTDEKLGIKRTSRFSASLSISIVGMLLAIGFGIYAASIETPPIYSFGLTLVLAIPFSLIWHWYPRQALHRRMSFAQVVSHEVARRRGHSDDAGRAKRRLIFGPWLPPRVRRSAQGAALTIVEFRRS